MTAKANAEKTAAQVCGERLGDIGALLDQLGQEVQAIRKEHGNGNNFDWGLCGDLGRTKERLIEAMTSLTAFSASEVEATSAELREGRE